MRRLKFGAIVFLDALGFKGIWSRQDPISVLQQLKSLRHNGLSLRGRARAGVLLNDPRLLHHVICVSDTIMVAVTLTRSNIPQRYLYRAMLSASLIASTMIDNAIHGCPSLLFRGCMAAGLMMVDGDFVIGPAVDEAAELFELSEGAFFWMAPSAMKINDTHCENFVDRIEPNLMIRYPVPLKDRAAPITLVFNYFGLTRPVAGWTTTCQKILQAFGDENVRGNIKEKRQNMVTFLDHVTRVRVRKVGKVGTLFTMFTSSRKNLRHHSRPDTLIPLQSLSLFGPGWAE
jgi:hypothetical protein